MIPLSRMKHIRSKIKSQELLGVIGSLCQDSFCIYSCSHREFYILLKYQPPALSSLLCRSCWANCCPSLVSPAQHRKPEQRVSQETCQAVLLSDSGCTVKAQTSKEFFKIKQPPPPFSPLIESMLTTANSTSIWCLQSTLYCKLKG